MQIDLTKRELEIIQAALQLVTPVGGGSEQFLLQLKLHAVSGSWGDASLTSKLWEIAKEDAIEAGALPRGC